MRRRKWAGRRRSKGQGGQSLVETAIALPLLLGIAFNIVNWAYLWFMVLAVSAAPRMGVQYATQGGQATTTVSAPGTTAVSNLVYENLTNAVAGATTSNVAVRVCTNAKGVSGSGTSQVTTCDTFGAAFAYPAIVADPEAPLYALDGVDVAYTFTPIIPGAAFSLGLPSPLTIHRKVYMRSLY
jgi:Flp pilus assembly protein TadG